MAEFFKGLWVNLTNRDVWDWWPTLNPLNPIYDEAGYVNNQPLFDFLYKVAESFDFDIKRKVIVTANDILTG